ncbi:hypothetical protein BO99DRAFT_464678 [Aspergillus violaceofuscus CBS 115571]|uniref:F-box domain-containing protein n=1 Tax=Aspergillus violaceofuscus (strain CBS 115571) TaxID=1450538 RepID=A0A2V5GYX1_ASPV1|nr:hypothetical protein BO99DRAFT_464678 [Aspergillus violaceofuscus CBS 115571]
MSSGLAYRLKEPGWNVLNLSSVPRASFRRAVKRYRKEALQHERSQRQEQPCYQPRASSSLRKQQQQQQHSSWILLPLEIIRMIFLDLDMLTLSHLRSVNKTTKQIIDSLPEYHLLHTHAADTLRLLDVTQCTHHFSVGQLYWELRHPQCRTCGDFGPFLFIPTCTRSCFACNRTHSQYRMAPIKVVFSWYGLSLDNDWHRLPLVHTLDCTRWTQHERMLVSIAQAKALHLQLAAPQARRSHTGDRRNSSNTWTPSPTRYSEYWGSRWRLSATVAFPYYDPVARSVETGVYCLGCVKYWENTKSTTQKDPVSGTPTTWEDYNEAWGTTLTPGSRDLDRAFLVQDLPAHFRDCPDVSRSRRRGKIAWRFGKPVGTTFRVSAEGGAVLRRSERLKK